MQKQLDENYPDLARRTRLAIPTFHAIGHGLECRKFSMRYTKGVGIHAGESIESMWAKLNKLGAQSRLVLYASITLGICLCPGDTILLKQMLLN